MVYGEEIEEEYFVENHIEKIVMKDLKRKEEYVKKKWMDFVVVELQVD